MFLENNQEYLALLYCTMFASAYYGLFRVGELTEAPGGHAMKAEDVQIAVNKDKIMFLLRSSKTHFKGDVPQLVKITALKTDRQDILQCPFKLLQKFINTRPRRRTNTEQFFVFRSREPVTATHFRKTLKSVMIRLKLNDEYYSAISFRSGRAVDLLRAGVSVETIKKLGRWKSNAVYKYLRTV